MWCYHPFIQRNKAKFEKGVGEGGGGQVIQGDLHKIGGLGTLCQLGILQKISFTIFTEKVLFSCIRKFFANICFRCFRYLNSLDSGPRPEGSYNIGSVCLSSLPSILPSMLFLKLTMVLGAQIWLCKTEPDFLEKIPIR